MMTADEQAAAEYTDRMGATERKQVYDAFLAGRRSVLSIEQLQEANLSRVARWHSLESWSALEWAGAMAGEAGEACNAAKKLKRIEDKIASINIGDRHYGDWQTAARAVGMEVADTVIYGALLCLRVDANLALCVKEAFNKKSEEYGFPERI